MRAISLKILGIFIFSKNILGQINNYAYENYLNCGHANPMQYSDCSISDLNTGFRCCYLTQVPGQKNTICALLSDTARQLHKPEYGYQGPPYFDCGNSTCYINLSFSLLILLIIHLLI